MMKNESAYWEQVARHHIASRRLYHVDAIIHVEDVDDIPFWTFAIKHVNPNKRVKFIASDFNRDGFRITGKKQCLKYIPYLNNSFLICIDSDFDYLLQDSTICDKPYVLQTYTYSWENHYCYAKALQKRWETVNKEFDFGLFLEKLNTIIYNSILTYLINKKYRKECFTLDELCSSILKVHFNKESLENNGEQYLCDINNSVFELYHSVSRVNVEVGPYIKYLNERGLTEFTAYLYMQGHCIYDLILRIGRFLLDGSQLDFEYQILIKEISFGDYPEIVNVQNDLSKALKT